MRSAGCSILASTASVAPEPLSTTASSTRGPVRVGTVRNLFIGEHERRCVPVTQRCDCAADGAVFGDICQYRPPVRGRSLGGHCRGRPMRTPALLPRFVFARKPTATTTAAISSNWASLSGRRPGAAQTTYWSRSLRPVDGLKPAGSNPAGAHCRGHNLSREDINPCKIHATSCIGGATATAARSAPAQR
jgi:hypothetical protein